MDPTCNFNGAYSNVTNSCICVYFYDVATNCSLTFFEAANPGTMIIYYVLALVFLLPFFGLYVPEVVLDLKSFRCRTFSTSAPLTKMVMLVYLTLTLIRVVMFVIGYHLNITQFGDYVFGIHDFVITIMLVGCQMAAIEYFGLLMKAENLGNTPRHVRNLRISMICIMIIGVLVTNVAFILFHLNLALSVTVPIVGFGSLFFFSFSLLVSGIYTIKTIHTLRKRMEGKTDTKSTLTRRSGFLLANDCVIIINYISLAVTPVQAGSTSQYISTLFVSMFFEYLIVILIFGFAQNHFWKNGKISILDSITQSSKGSSSAKSDSKSSGHSTTSTLPPSIESNEPRTTSTEPVNT